MTSKTRKTKPPVEMKKPENFDMEKGAAVVMKVIEEHEAWLKEMAAR